MQSFLEVNNADWASGVTDKPNNEVCFGACPKRRREFGFLWRIRSLRSLSADCFHYFIIISLDSGETSVGKIFWSSLTSISREVGGERSIYLLIWISRPKLLMPRLVIISLFVRLRYFPRIGSTDESMERALVESPVSTPNLAAINTIT